jgi:hypothetical protein
MVGRLPKVLVIRRLKLMYLLAAVRVEHARVDVGVVVEGLAPLPERV